MTDWTKQVRRPHRNQKSFESNWPDETKAPWNGLMRRMASHPTRLSYLLLFVWALGCASVRTGTVAEPHEAGPIARASSAGIVLRGIENTRLSGGYVMVIDFTLENRTNGWIRVEDTALDFGSERLNASIYYPAGNDLIAWAEARQREIDVSDYNTAVALGALAALGGIAAMATDHDAGRIGGLAAVGLATGGLSAISFRRQIEALESPDRDPRSLLFPTNHLLHGGFVIPPDSHTKKWIAVYASDHAILGALETLQLCLTLNRGGRDCFNLKFRASRSRWARTRTG
jgi:hypothetical protein